MELHVNNIYTQRFLRRTFSFQLLVWLLLVFGYTKNASAQTIDIPTGSYIINMGITPQTVNNALRPYGMIYDLIKNYNVQVVWSINPSKDKDGIDFSHNGVNYKGGTFIIPTPYRIADVNTRIAYWESQGVVGATTVSPITVPLHKEIKGAPRWTLDKKNGKIARSYLDRAMIPASAYGGTNEDDWKDPDELDCCDDLFAMPHADPNWATHGHLVTWNLDCKGGIWSGCSAVSALENMVNTANRSQQGNFLSEKDPNWTGSSGSYTNNNSLVLANNHDDGTPPYTYREDGHPIMQFMGDFDAASLSGAERVYIPRQGIVSNSLTYNANAVARWRPTTSVLVYDPTMSQVTNPNLTTFQNVAAIAIYGRGFGDEDRGYVMYQASHQLDRATLPANIAGMRAFLNFSFFSSNERIEEVNPVLSPTIPDTFYSLDPVTLSFTFPAGVNPANYSISWQSSCGGSFIPNATSNPTVFDPPVVFTPTQCIINITVTDACGRSFTDAKPVIILPCRLNITNDVTNVACFGEATGEIVMTITGDPGPFDWSWTRATPPGSGSGPDNIISNLPFGTYNITVTNNGACTTSFVQPITQPSEIVLSQSVNGFQCFGERGFINVSVAGGVPPYSYSWTGPNGFTSSDRDIYDLLGGTYNLTVTDDNGCEAFYSGLVTGPTEELAIDMANAVTNVTCFGFNDGIINLNVTGGTPGYSYSWDDGPTTALRENLAPGSYTVTVTDDNGCFITETFVITQSPLFTLVRSKIDPTCPPDGVAPLGADGAVDITVFGGQPPYLYEWSTIDGSGLVPANEDQTGLSSGTYTVLVTDDNGCQISTSTILIYTNPMPLPPGEITNN